MDEINRSDIIHIKPEPPLNEDQLETEGEISKDASQDITENWEMLKCG